VPVLCYTAVVKNELPSQLQSEIERGIVILKNGGVIAYPTDTVYGLGCAAFNHEAVARIFQVKQRPISMPLPILVSSEEQILTVAASFPESARILVRRFMPGGLTVIVEKSRAVPGIVTSGGRTVGVRIPDHPVALAIIRGLGAPIIGTSANISTRPSPLTATEVREQLGDTVDLIIDGGRCPGGRESTIIDVTGEIPRVVRAGAVPLEDIRKALGGIVLKEGQQT
jgi:L-threonylcarbamoyladenylate synthase